MGSPSGDHDPAPERVAHGNLDDAAGAVDPVAFLDQVRLAEERRADVVLFEVQRHAEHVVGKLQELSGRGVVQTVDAGDAVSRGQDGPDLLDLYALVVVLDLFLDNAGYLGRPDIHESLPWTVCCHRHRGGFETRPYMCAFSATRAGLKPAPTV